MIKVVAFQPSRKGDLFTERMTDLIHAIGFEIESINLHRSGRELDILASHRLEKRHALVECKAQDEKIGGSDINKFIGVLDAERRRIPSTPVAGYFVSLSGFKDSAIAQEADLGHDRCSLLGEVEIRRELESARIIVPLARAIATATSAVDDTSYAVNLDGQLLATEYGWVWQIFFDRNNLRSGYILIHADGHPLPTTQASALAAVLTDVSNLTLLVAAQPEYDSGALEALYLEFIESECGKVTYEGLPADSQVSAGVDLEQLYVPLFIEEWRDDKDQIDSNRHVTDVPGRRVSIGQALEKSRHISLVGAPGSGKSTLLNRIALAYACSDNQFRTDAGLTQADYLPILVRCREMPATGWTFSDLILSLAQQFSHGQGEGEFQRLVTSAMRRGRALILVDGLDEITSAGQRVSFIRNLRNLLTTYPTNQLIITSREPGFRPVAGVLADYCARYSSR